MRQHVSTHGHSMYSKAAEGLLSDIEDAITAVGPKFDDAAKVATTQLLQELSIMLDKNCAAGNRSTPRALIKPGQKQVETMVRNHMVTLSEAWCQQDSSLGMEAPERPDYIDAYEKPAAVDVDALNDDDYIDIDD
jgi:hypothetical protein